MTKCLAFFWHQTIQNTRDRLSHTHHNKKFPARWHIPLRYSVQTNVAINQQIIILSKNRATCLPVPVAARSKAWVCDRSPAEIVGSNPTGDMDVCVLSGRGLWDELITRPEEYYRLWCVIVCNLETLWLRRPWPMLGPQRHRKKGYMFRLKWLAVIRNKDKNII